MQEDLNYITVVEYSQRNEFILASNQLICFNHQMEGDKTHPAKVWLQLASMGVEPMTLALLAPRSNHLS